MKIRIQAAVVALFAASVAQAQQAVQWKVSDGGNGHWYQRIVIPGGITWTAARDQATVLGGHLATISTAAENSFVFQSSGVSSWATRYGPWLGGFQTPESVEPGAGWRWVTDERWTFTNWDGAEPNNGCNTNPDENALQYIDYGAGWNDIPDEGRCDTEGPVAHFMAEWSADCNGDGIVDYGQCRDGSLPDYDGNNIPDCCEQGTPCVVSSYPVQWRVSEGGNGHWYAAISSPGIAWADASDAAVHRGGLLVTLTSPEENVFAVSSFQNSSPRYPWIGLKQSPDAVEPLGGWTWVTGELLIWSNWSPSEPNGDPGFDADQANIWLVSEPGRPLGTWNDWHTGGPDGFVIEWSADCNNDGVVDKGQILRGQLLDADDDGVPDVCQQLTCVDADIFRDFNVNGADLGILLSQWGPNTPLTESDLNRDGTVDGIDLGVLLSFWGACP